MRSADDLTIVDYNMAPSYQYNFDIYQRCNPKASAYYMRIGNHFEELALIYFVIPIMVALLNVVICFFVIFFIVLWYLVNLPPHSPGR